MKSRARKLSLTVAVVVLMMANLACGRERVEPTQPPPLIVPTATPGGGDSAAPLPPTTPPEATSTSVPGSCADGMQFVADVSVPDGTIFGIDTPFIKAWRLRNAGECFWSGYHLVFSAGEPMGTMEQPIPDMPAGEEFDISIEMTAPGGAGNYTGSWQVQSPSGAVLGTVTCVIQVVGDEALPQPLPTEEPTEPPPEQPTEAPLEEPVGPPSNLHVSGWGMYSLTFEWNDAGGEASYILTLGSESVTLEADTTSYQWENPPCGTSVGVTLIARNADGAEIGRAELFGVNTPECQLPNLVIVDAHFEPAEPKQGESFDARFTIRNDGAVATGPFDVVWGFHPNLGLEECRMRNDGLNPGQTATGRCTRQTTANPGGYRTTLTLDAGGEVDESEEGDNSESFALRIRAQ